jgi:RNA polymerase sigma-70 factor, ECF subfamily
MGLALTAAELTVERIVTPPGEIDAETLFACQRGERRAMRRFVGHYQNVVFAFISRMVGAGPHVEDLSQDVFIRAYRALPRFELRSDVRLSTWLLKIAVRLVQDHRKRRRPVLVPLVDDMVPSRGADHPERAHRNREIRRAFERAAAQLSDEHRMVFVLAQFHGLTMTEIGELLCLPDNTVKTRLYRARQKLRQLLQEMPEAL